MSFSGLHSMTEPSNDDHTLVILIKMCLLNMIFLKTTKQIKISLIDY